jgi:hypothetical protein
MIENLAVGATAGQKLEFVATIRELVETRELSDQALKPNQTAVLQHDTQRTPKQSRQTASLSIL